MKIIFILFFVHLLPFSNLYSAEIEMQTNSRVQYDEFIFTNNSKYIIINQEGQWTDNIGNNWTQECKVLIMFQNSGNLEA